MIKVNLFAFILIFVILIFCAYHFVTSAPAFKATTTPSSSFSTKPLDKKNNGTEFFIQKKKDEQDKSHQNLEKSILSWQEENTRLKRENIQLQEEVTELNRKNIQLQKAIHHLENKPHTTDTEKSKEISSTPTMDSPYKKVFPKTYRMKGPALSNDPTFFRILQVTSLSKEQKILVVDLIAEYKSAEEEILTKPRGNTIKAEVFASELEENISYFDQKFINILTEEQMRELDFILKNKN